MAVIGLVHGVGGSAATMRPLAAALEARGHDVVLVTLPGHGTSPDDLVGVGWSDWLAAVPSADVLIGQSMGASLVLTIAPLRQVRAIVAINPPMADEDALEGLEWRRSRGHEWIDLEAQPDGGFSRLPIATLIEMMEGVNALDLGAVMVPVLLVRGALDDTSDPQAIDAFAACVGGPVHRLTLPHSGHVATLGPDLDMLIDAIDELL